MENEIENIVYLQQQEEIIDYTQYEQNSLLIMSNTNSKVDSIYNCLMISTMVVLSIALYMFVHNILKRKEI